MNKRFALPFVCVLEKFFVRQFLHYSYGGFPPFTRSYDKLGGSNNRSITCSEYSWDAGLTEYICFDSSFLISTLSCLRITEGYPSTSSYAMALNSCGMIPSLVKKPWDSFVTAFLGLPSSTNNVLLCALPKTRAEFKPAGQPPIIVQSYINIMFTLLKPLWSYFVYYNFKKFYMFFVICFSSLCSTFIAIS